jgi:hypothetical protein
MTKTTELGARALSLSVPFTRNGTNSFDPKALTALLVSFHLFPFLGQSGGQIKYPKLEVVQNSRKSDKGSDSCDINAAHCCLFGEVSPNT